MSPGKLFAYLDGTLPMPERAEIEERLCSDVQLQREMEMARQISLRGGEAREVILEDEMAASAKGRKMALRIGVGFIVLVGLNVAFGLWVIGRREAANPNRKLIDQQIRQQITNSLNAAAQAVMTPLPALTEDVQVTVEKGRADAVANEIVMIASRLGASATKGLLEGGATKVLVSLAPNRIADLRGALSTLAGVKAIAPGQLADHSGQENVSVIVEISEEK